MRKLLFIILFAVTILPFIGLQTFNVIQNYRLEKDGAVSGLVGQAFAAAAYHERYIQDTYELLEDIARSPAVQSRDKIACRTNLILLQKKSEIYTGFAVADTAGNFWCNSISSEEGVNVANRLYFERVMSGGSFSVGEYSVGRLTQKEILPFAFPVSGQDGKIAGVVVAAADISKINASVNANINTASLDELLSQGYVSLLLDHDGVLLSRLPSNPQYAGIKITETELFENISEIIASGVENGFFEAKDIIDNTQRVYAFTKVSPGTNGLEDIDLYVLVGLPPSSLFASVNTALLKDVGILALFIAISGMLYFALFHVASGAVGRRINQPRPPGL